MNPLITDFPDRIVTLSTGTPGLRGSIHVQIQPPEQIENQKSKIENPSAPILDFISSDETLDRYSEIICASGWRLDSYRRNPVFQNAHQYGDIIFTLGKALVTEVRQINGRSCLYQRIEFAVDANPIAKIAYALYRGAYISTVSVGFIPIRWEDSPDSSPTSSSISSSSSSSACRRRYLEQELLEVSAVAIPANPNALALALKSGAIERATLAETIEVLRSADTAPIENQKSKIENPPSLLCELYRIMAG